MIFRYLLVLCALLYLITSTSFGQLAEDFSYKDWGKQTRWQGHEESFLIADGKLQSDGPASANSMVYLSTQVSIKGEAIWQFTIDLKFNPTSANFARVYLGADKSALDEPLNGYFLQLGQTNDDFIKIFKQSQSEMEEVFNSNRSLGNSNIKITVYVSRDTSGVWKIYTTKVAEEEKSFEGSFQDTTFLHSQWFGFYCQYATASRSTQFYFDEIYINAQAKKDRVQTKFKELIITEVMADPSPSVDLPEKEYIELYNRSSDTINLNGFALMDSTGSCSLTDAVIYPNNYLLLCDIEDTIYFKGNVLGCKGLPSLNNTSDHLRLYNPDNLLIDEVRYSVDYYQNQEKSAGGWSLELINLEEPCLLSENWGASTSVIGGTPGNANAIASDKKTNVKFKSLARDKELSLTCNKLLDTTNLKALNWTCVPPVNFNDHHFNKQHNTFYFNTKVSFTRNSSYNLSIQSLKDCVQSPIKDSLLSIRFLVPDTASPGDIVINEVLFNPSLGGSDFVEIYNRSEKFIDISDWTISSLTSKNYSLQSAENILSPHSYLAFAADKSMLLALYHNAPSSTVVEASLPPLNDDFGMVGLKNKSGNMMDEMSYDEKMHHVLVKNKEGVSLERISPFAPSASIDSWHSAAATSGFATPGYENSQHINLNDQNFSIDPRVFSPNEDGYKDFAIIRYNFESPGYVASLNIYDANGRHIKTLANNFSLSTEGIFQWDGTDEEHRMAIPGQYIVVFNSYHISGDVKDFKEVVVLGF